MLQGYEISEYSTGTAIVRYSDTRKAAIDKLQKTIDRIGADKTREAILRFPRIND